MDRMKRFVVLPLGLLIINLALSLYRNPWRSFFNYRLDFWQKAGYFLRGLSACAVYILLIALLFIFVFTRVRISELFKKPALKAMGIVFAAELAIKLLLFSVINPLISRPELDAAKHGIQMNDWYSVVVHGLPSFLIGFAVIYFTLGLLIKPLNLRFSFHRTAFFLSLFICVAVSVLEDYGLLQITKNIKVSDDMTLVTIQALSVTVDWNLFSNSFTVIGVIVITLLDIMIFAFINSCTKQNSIPAFKDENSIHS